MALAHCIYVCSPSAWRCHGYGCSIKRVSHLVPSEYSRLSFPCCPAGELAQLTKENYGILTGLYPWYHWHQAAIVQACPKPQRSLVWCGGSPLRLALPITIVANSGTSTTVRSTTSLSVLTSLLSVRQRLHDHPPRRPL
jgi:hypothetical protein